MTNQPPSVPAVNIEEEAREWATSNQVDVSDRQGQLLVSMLAAFHRDMRTKEACASDRSDATEGSSTSEGLREETGAKRSREENGAHSDEQAPNQPGASLPMGVEEIMEVVKEWENDVSLGKLPMRHDAWFNDLRSRLTALLSKEGSGQEDQGKNQHATTT